MRCAGRRFDSSLEPNVGDMPSFLIMRCDPMMGTWSYLVSHPVPAPSIHKTVFYAASATDETTTKDAETVRNLHDRSACATHTDVKLLCYNTQTLNHLKDA
mmetsp:Transcript_46075/g.53865  ORF Transcript_46075/g.53865 Transcript_46075/m.53865 type:complete len:101 (+) Transcript_46075:167-469(+)